MIGGSAFRSLRRAIFGKKLQFPRTRHSRDRIAERAIRGGLRNLRPVISRCANFRACAFCGATPACQASRARGIPVIGLQVEPLQKRGSAFRPRNQTAVEKSFSFRVRGVIGLRSERPVISRCANFPRACFVRGDACAHEATCARGINAIGLQVEPL